MEENYQPRNNRLAASAGILAFLILTTAFTTGNTGGNSVNPPCVAYCPVVAASYLPASHGFLTLNDTYQQIGIVTNGVGAFAEAFFPLANGVWAYLTQASVFINASQNDIFTAQIFTITNANANAGRGDVPKTLLITSTDTPSTIGSGLFESITFHFTIPPLNGTSAAFTLKPTDYFLAVECLGCDAAPAQIATTSNSGYPVSFAQNSQNVWQKTPFGSTAFNMLFSVQGVTSKPCGFVGDSCNLARASTTGITANLKNLIKNQVYCTGIGVELYTNATTRPTVRGQYTFRARNATVSMQIAVGFVGPGTSFAVPFQAGQCSAGGTTTNVYITTPILGILTQDYVTQTFTFAIGNVVGASNSPDYYGGGYIAFIQITPLSNSVQIDQLGPSSAIEALGLAA